MVDFMTELAADNLLPLRQAVPPPEALAAPEPEPPDPRTLRARFYEGVGLTVLDGTIRLSTAVDATSGLVAELRVPAAERPWTVSIDETENTPGPGFRWRELIINGNALGRYVKATGTFALHEATQPGCPDMWL